MDIKPLYDHCFIADNIQSGDRFPVGGSLLDSKHTIELVVDYDTFYDEFRQLSEKHIAAYTSSPLWQDWFSEQCAPVELQTLLQSFVSAHAKYQRDKPEPSGSARHALYNASTPTLSEMLRQGQDFCIERSLLAQKYLVEHGIEARVFSGEYLRHFDSGKDNFTSDHSFVLLKYNGQEYIFDPAQSLSGSNDTQLFCLLKPCKPIGEGERLSNGKCLVACEDVLTHTTRYYGVGSHTNVYAKHLVTDNWQDALRKRTGHSRSIAGDAASGDD